MTTNDCDFDFLVATAQKIFINTMDAVLEYLYMFSHR